MIHGGKPLIADITNRPKAPALVALRQGQIEDHPVTIRMVFGGGGLEVGEFQLHKFTR